MKRIFVVDSERPAQEPTDETTGQLDDLRSEFLLDLSHQLRTPVTAMKLAMDGLFSQIRDVLTPSQQNLVNISRRNIERVAALVENQLDLLQMMAGNRPVCRRLTDLDRLLRGLGRRPFDDDAEYDGQQLVVERAAGLDTEGPLYAFTDPEQLAAVLNAIVGGGTPDSKRRIRLSYEESECVYQLDILVDLLGQQSPEPADGVPGLPPALDFESRAFRAIVERLDGDAVIDMDETRRWARIRLPRYPDYDGEKDFLGPARRLRSAWDEGRMAEEEVAAAVHFIRCDMGETADTDFLAAGNSVIRDFIASIYSFMSEGDAIIRGRHHGSIYLVLTDRAPVELERIATLLSRGEGAGPHVSSPQTIRTNEPDIDRLVCDLELV
jgi:hypothetical protein